MNMPDINFADDIGFDIEDDVYNQYNGRNVETFFNRN